MELRRLSSGAYHVRLDMNRFAQGYPPYLKHEDFFGDWSAAEKGEANKLVAQQQWAETMSDSA